jgi:hypothetical protein
VMLVAVWSNEINVGYNKYATLVNTRRLFEP